MARAFLLVGREGGAAAILRMRTARQETNGGRSALSPFVVPAGKAGKYGIWKAMEPKPERNVIDPSFRRKFTFCYGDRMGTALDHEMNPETTDLYTAGTPAACPRAMTPQTLEPGAPGSS